MGEKRRYMRFNVFIDGLSRHKGGANKNLSINNFSKEGVGFVSHDPLTPGEELEIEMLIPGDNMPVVVNGEVAWASAPEQDSCHYRGGVRFKKISNGDKSRLLEYIYNRWIIPAGPGEV
jgi:c-di-GMP-binding flagellar brake protein YcgR